MHSFLSLLLSFHLLFSAILSPTILTSSNILFTETTPSTESAPMAEENTQTPSAGTNAADSTLAASITAPGAVLMEASTGTILFEKDSHTARHPASITKIMTLILIFDAIEKGSIHLTDTVSVSEHAASMGGSQVFLEPGETQDVETMIKCISIASANDACVALIYSRH